MRSAYSRPDVRLVVNVGGGAAENSYRRRHGGQILINLGNSMKFTTVGEVRLTVDLPKRRRPDEPHLLLRFRVIDTGPGIDTRNAATAVSALPAGPAVAFRLPPPSGLGLVNLSAAGQGVAGGTH